MTTSRKVKIYSIVVLFVILFIILSNFTDLIVEYIWLNDLKYSQIFWRIKETQGLLFIGALLITVLYIGSNVRCIVKNIKPLRLNLGQMPDGQMKTVQVSPKRAKTFLYILTGVVGVLFALGWSVQWNTFFQFAHAQNFEVVDPIFGIDVSFYMFRLPFINAVQNSLIFLVFFVTTIITVYHLASGGITWPTSKPTMVTHPNKTAFRQVFLNVSLWFLLLGIGFYLDRFHLLFKDNELIYGANYTDIHVLLPVYWVMAAGSVLLAIFALVQMSRQKLKPFVMAALGLLVVGIVGQVIFPSVVQNFTVDPSEYNVEKPYLEHSIAYSRKAYNLDEVKVKEYNAVDSVTLEQMMKHQAAIKNIRVWDQNLTVDTYKQLQEIRLYYEFYNIDLDRYHTPNGYRQVLISGRELTETLPPKAQTWVNQRLQYTHGYGVVMSPTTQKTEEGSPVFYINNIPPQSSIGFEVKQPAIYYGESASGYKLVNTKIKEMDYPRGDKNVYTHYDGAGGVSIDGFFEQLLYAWHFGDFNIMLTNYIQEGSKIQFWRSVRKRVKKIAPFLRLEQDPYLVLNEGKLYWIVDAYTIASNYPYADPYDDRYGYNYIRNSVKVVVDAYHGTVDFYVSNAKDPVIQVYQEIFPEVFQPLANMPKTLKEHVKYPKELFRIQLQKFSTYHMTNPQVFYNQEDLWERPVETYGGQQIRMDPYYLLGILPDTEKLQYMLISPMTPRNRDNMISWMVVKSDYPDYGQIINYELPKEKLFLGPAQIEAKINQNTKISRQLSLWDQKGSKVIRGNLMVIPIENSFLYVEPVFLFSTTLNMPQLKRVIATTGNSVVMEPTLQEAILALYGKEKIPTTSVAVENLSKQVTERVITPQLEQLKDLWQEMQSAMQSGDWKNFGDKMEAINELLQKAE